MISAQTLVDAFWCIVGTILFWVAALHFIAWLGKPRDKHLSDEEKAEQLEKRKKMIAEMGERIEKSRNQKEVVDEEGHA